MRASAEDGIAGGIECPAAKEGMAQTPGIGVLGLGNPRSDMPGDLVLGNAAGANAVAQAAPAVAEAAYVLLRQSPLTGARTS